MKFLITGSTGFVGKILCADLLRRGHSVRLALRTANLLTDAVDVRLVGEIDANTDWADALCGVDVVIHLAARVHVMKDDSPNPLEDFLKINLEGTVNLARQAVAAKVKRLVYVSSIKVNGEITYEGRKITEMDAPFPQDPYGISKWEAEKALHRIMRETDLEVVIVRPPLVYGPGVKGNFAQMLKVLEKRLPLPFASVNNLRSLIYVENLVDALYLCATHPLAVGQTYLVSDGDDVSTPGLLCQLGDSMAHPARLFSFPVPLIKFVGILLGKRAQIERLLGSLRVDSGKIRRELNWLPPYSSAEGLRNTGRQYKGVGKINRSEYE